ncbi:retrotransposon del1-46-like protein [Gossypium australe]|uniref:Retrotransposon del1-46-like protein n=1 Tax=Gossypium australe TaxID=47621 RepID=A0A5B6VC27_9ROSI|nr:retrotransposon del1-46-like protein [Gossypium australe]
MDWLTLYNAIVNCKRTSIDLRSQNGEIVRIESSDLNGLPAVISSMEALNCVKKRITSIREVEFGIELVPGTTPISIASYRMASTELKELKS